tara:strand:+ start:396 stop:569 length:174 start_codon:yes stop_codon:yes gene_type:complete
MYFVLDIGLLLFTDYKNTKKKQAKENKKDLIDILFNNLYFFNLLLLEYLFLVQYFKN